MTRVRIVSLVAVLAALVVPAAPAEAGLMVYTSLASFEAATTRLTDVNFNGIVPSGGFQGFVTPPGFTRSGVNFDLAPPNNNNLNVTAKDYYFVNFGGPTYPQDFLVNAFNPSAVTQTEVIRLPPGTTAVGFDLGTFSGQGLDFSFSTGDAFHDPSTPNFGHTSFLGFTSSAPITSLSITFAAGATLDGLIIDDLKFGAAVGVPEPSTLALFGLAGAALATWRRKRATA